jgi:hypothetical protein
VASFGTAVEAAVAYATVAMEAQQRTEAAAEEAVQDVEEVPVAQTNVVEMQEPEPEAAPSSRSVRKRSAAAAASPPPKAARPNVPSPATATAAPPTFGLIQKVNNIKKELQLEPSLERQDAIKQANELMGIDVADNMSLPMQVHELLKQLGVDGTSLCRCFQKRIDGASRCGFRAPTHDRADARM